MANRKSVFTPSGSHTDGQAPGTSSRARANRAQAAAISSEVSSQVAADAASGDNQHVPLNFAKPNASAAGGGKPQAFQASANRMGRTAKASQPKQVQSSEDALDRATGA